MNLPKMDSDFEGELNYFLQSKGFSKLLIKQTVNEFTKKGIVAFTMAQLSDAYQKMIDYHNNVKPVGYPPVFFANGVSMSVDLSPKKVEVKQPESSGKVPFYDWLGNGKYALPYDNKSEDEKRIESMKGAIEQYLANRVSRAN
jgi:hypothetical protein